MVPQYSTVALRLSSTLVLFLSISMVPGTFLGSRYCFFLMGNSQAPPK